MRYLKNEKIRNQIGLDGVDWKYVTLSMINSVKRHLNSRLCLQKRNSSRIYNYAVEDFDNDMAYFVSFLKNSDMRIENIINEDVYDLEILDSFYALVNEIESRSIPKLKLDKSDYIEEFDRHISILKLGINIGAMEIEKAMSDISKISFREVIESIVSIEVGLEVMLQYYYWIHGNTSSEVSMSESQFEDFWDIKNLIKSMQNEIRLYLFVVKNTQMNTLLENNGESIALEYEDINQYVEELKDSLFDYSFILNSDMSVFCQSMQYVFEKSKEA